MRRSCRWPPLPRPVQRLRLRAGFPAAASIGRAASPGCLGGGLRSGMRRVAGLTSPVCPSGAGIACRPCALPLDARQISGFAPPWGLPRSFSHAPRKSMTDLQQALIRFLRCRENTSAMQNRQILVGFKKSGPAQPHPIQGAEIFPNSICILSGFVFISSPHASGAALPAAPCWGIVQW